MWYTISGPTTSNTRIKAGVVSERCHTKAGKHDVYTPYKTLNARPLLKIGSGHVMFMLSCKYLTFGRKVSCFFLYLPFQVSYDLTQFLTMGVHSESYMGRICKGCSLGL